MKKSDKKAVFYWVAIYAFFTIGIAIGIIILLSRRPMRNELFDLYLASDHDTSLLAKYKLFDYMTKLYAFIPIICGTILSFAVDYFTRKRLIYRLPVVFFASAIIIYTAFFTLMYVFREALSDTFFAALSHVIIIFIAILLPLPFKNYKTEKDK